MADDLAWVSIAVRQPQDEELVYARAKAGTPQKVTYYADPPRWIGSSIVYRSATQGQTDDDVRDRRLPE